MYSDQEVLQLISKGDEKGMQYLYDQYYRYLCHAVYKILKDSNTVEDIVQEVYLEIWKKKEQIDIHISLKAYLRRASINKSLNYIRAQKMSFEEDDGYKDSFIDDDNLHDRLEVEELQKAVDISIEALPERCRLVFAMSRYESMSYKEISEALDISIKTVENQISKALRILREAIITHNELN